MVDSNNESFSYLVETSQRLVDLAVESSASAHDLQLIDQFINAFSQLAKQNSCLLWLIANQCPQGLNKHSLLFIRKALIIIYLLQRERANSATIRTALLAMCTMTRINIRVSPKSPNDVILLAERSANILLRNKADQDTAKLLTIVAQRNRFKATEKLLQSVLILSFISVTKQVNKDGNMRQAILSTLDELIGSPYTACVPILSRWIDKRFELGSIFRSHSVPLGLYLGDNNEGEAVGFLFQQAKITADCEINLIPADALHHAYFNKGIPSPLLDVFFSDELASFGLVNCWPDIGCQSLSRTVHRYFATEHLSNMLQQCQYSDKKNLIANINASEELKSLILDHATLANRAQTKIVEIEHALALLGEQSLGLVIALNMFKNRQAEEKSLGHGALQTKFQLYATIGRNLFSASNDVTGDQAELLFRCLLGALVTIPKANFVGRSHAVMGDDGELSSDLAQLFANVDRTNWDKIFTQLCLSWRLPKTLVNTGRYYIAYCQNIEAKAHALNRTDVASIALCTVLFQSMLNGNLRLTHPLVSLLASRLNLSIEDIQHHVERLISQSAPASDLL